MKDPLLRISSGRISLFPAERAAGEFQAVAVLADGLEHGNLVVSKISLMLSR